MVVQAGTAGSWGTPIEVPSGGVGSYLGGQATNDESVACDSSGSCFAVGFYYDSAGDYLPMMVTESGGDWGSSSSIGFSLPSGAASYAVGQAALMSDVACDSSGSCFAVGTYVDGSGSQQGMVLTESVAANPPVNTSPPTISGTSDVDGTLTAENGSWSGDTPITYTYQWQDCTSPTDVSTCTNVSSGGTGGTRVLSGSDVGQYVRVVVTATNDAGSASATSSVTDIVVSVPAVSISPSSKDFGNQGITAGPIATQDFTVTNTGSADLHITTTSLTGTGLSQFDITTNTCKGATVAPAGTCTVEVSFEPSTPGSKSASLTLADDASDSPQSVALTGAGVGVVAPTNTAPPTVSGTDIAGQTLSAGIGTWTGSPTSYSYQWQDCTSVGSGCAKISNATSATYVLSSGAVGLYVRVVVTATNSAGSASAASVPTSYVAGVPPANSRAPAISSAPPPHQGVAVSASYGTWTGVPAPTFTYQWQHCASVDAGTCSDVPDSGGASTGLGTSYTPVAGDVGLFLRLGVTATNSTGAWVDPVTTYSPESGPVGPFDGGSPSVGMDIYGQVDPGTLSTSPGLPSPLGYSAVHPWTVMLLTTGNTSATYDEPVGAYDDTGTGTGWNETITSTEYTGISGAALTSGAHGSAAPFEFGASGDSSLTSATDEASTLGAIGTTPIADSYVASPGDTGLSSSPQGATVIPQGGATGSPSGAVGFEPVGSVFYEADLGTGMGDFNLSLPVTVVIPADAYAGIYESTATFAIVSGP